MSKLRLEVLNGPLDGAEITLREAAEWSQEGSSQLSFPWDAALGQPQARFYPDGQGWFLEGFDTPHGTYCLNRDLKIREPMLLEPGDILKASKTWFLVRQVEQEGI